jgi:hypothetical protein
MTNGLSHFQVEREVDGEFLAPRGGFMPAAGIPRHKRGPQMSFPMLGPLIVEVRIPSPFHPFVDAYSPAHSGFYARES